MSTKHIDRDGLHRRRGIWYFGYIDPITRKYRELSTATSNFEEAKRVRRRREDEISDGTVPSDKSKLKLEIAVSEWFKDATLRMQETTIAVRKFQLAPICDLFGHLRLEQIGIDQVRSYQRTRSRVVSAVTVNMEVQRLRTVLQFFKQGKRLEDDYKPLPAAPSGVGRALSDADEKTLWTVAQTKADYLLTYNIAVLVKNTGMRRSELLKLKLEQIDLEAGELWVRKGRQGGRDDLAKTKASRRIVPMNEHALVAVATVLETAKERGAHLPEHYLFPAHMHKRPDADLSRSAVKLSGKGKALRAAGGTFDPTRYQKGFRTAWRTFTRAAGLKGLRVHDLRHHFATVLAEADTPEATALALLGHMSPEMWRHYQHIRDRKKRQAVKALEATNLMPAAEMKQAIAAGMTRKPVKPAGEVIEFPAIEGKR